MVMGLSLKPEHLKRYKHVAGLFIKYGRSDVIKEAGFNGAVDDPPRSIVNGDSLSLQK